MRIGVSSREVGFDSHLVEPLDPEALSTLLARLPQAGAVWLQAAVA